MSVDIDEVRALAQAFARKLEHLREFRGVAYVRSAPTPASDDGAGGEQPEVFADPSEPEPIASRPQERPPRNPERAADPAPRDQQWSPTRPPTPAPPSQTAYNPPAPQSLHFREGQQSSRPDNRSGSPRPEPAPARPQEWSPEKKLAYLRDRNVGDCQRCPLARTRRNIVFGVGNPEADLMFVGEAPGADEDRLGEPFVGAAGRRLDQWIERLGMRRSDVYIANVLKCRPPGNRDPQAPEIERCSPFLHAQIRAIEPKVIVALGRFSGCLLLERDLKLWQMRDAVHSYREPKSGVEIPLIVTFHPAYVLRSEQRPPAAASGHARTDRGGAIKSEDEKVLDDIARAVSLARARV